MAAHPLFSSFVAAARPPPRRDRGRRASAGRDAAATGTTRGQLGIAGERARGERAGGRGRLDRDHADARAGADFDFARVEDVAVEDVRPAVGGETYAERADQTVEATVTL